MTGLDRFAEFYRMQLKIAVEERPEEYALASGIGIDVVADRMIASFTRAAQTGSAGFNKDGTAIVRTCRMLGIKHTYKAMIAYFQQPYV